LEQRIEEQNSERGKDTEPYRQKRKISETQSSGHGKWVA